MGYYYHLYFNNEETKGHFSPINWTQLMVEALSSFLACLFVIIQ